MRIQQSFWKAVYWTSDSTQALTLLEKDMLKWKNGI